MSLSSLNGKLIIFDVETTGLNPWGSFEKYGYWPARPFAFAFTDSDGNQAYVRWEVDPKTRRVIPDSRTRRDMSELLGDPAVVKVGHNLAFDIRMSRMSGIKFDWTRIHDTLPLAHIFTGGGLQATTHYALKPLAAQLAGIPDDDEKALEESVKKARNEAKAKGWMIATKESHGEKAWKADYWLADRGLCKTYALQDTVRAAVIFMGIIKDLRKTPKRFEVYQNEIRLLRSIYRSETRGLRVFPEKLDELEKFYSEYMNKWKKVADAEGGKGMNFNSPKQMVKVFVGDRGYRTKNRTATGQPSVDAAELKRLSEKDKLAKAILEYKAGDDMLTKFIKPYRRFMVLDREGVWVLHPNFRQCGTTTGRTSCADPNLQQAAAEDSAKKQADIGLRPREALGPRAGFIWYQPDFSQMEVWIFAFHAKDKILMKALLAGEDIHTATSTQVWGDRRDFKENAKLYRKKGKTMQFLKQYGGTAKAAAALMNCSRYEAQQTVDEYDERLPGVAAFVDKMTSQAERDGFIENPFGRWAPLDPRFAYKAVNYDVQGTCADIMKRAYVRLDAWLRRAYPEARLLGNVHDELIIEVPERFHSKRLMRKIVRLMQTDSTAAGLPVPLPVTMKTTRTFWSNAKETQL